MPNSCCDLHLHTYYSDGRASPAEILRHAAGISLKTVAITDHDNLNAAQEAVHIANDLGLELIPGIEFTSRWDQCLPSKGANPFSQDLDVLGYDFNSQDPALQDFAQATLTDLQDRITDCCTQLTQAGYPITVYDVLDENPHYPGAMQLISALWHKGYAESWNNAYTLFAQAWPKVRHSRFTIQKVIEALHAAGGVAVLAHPVAVKCQNGWLNGEQVAQMVEMGLDGLEVLHPRLDSQARLHFLNLAKYFNMLITGGSDEHGWDGRFARMGSELVTYEMVNAIHHRAEKYH